MNKKIVFLTLLLAFSLVNPKAKAGVLMVAYGGYGVHLANTSDANSGIRALEYLFATSVLIGGTGIVIGGVADLFGQGGLKTAAIVLNSKAPTETIEEALTKLFPFIDDPYVVQSLALTIVKAYEGERGILHNQNVFEALVSEREILETLEPAFLTEEQKQRVILTISQPLQGE